MTYKQQLLRQEWKDKRLEIVTRDNHCCTKCGKDKYLQVHHTYYTAGKFAWEYPNESLVTLCRTCHKKEHAETEIKVIGKSEQKYVKLYLVEESDLNNCGKPAQLALRHILNYMDYNNVVHLIKYTRLEICKKSGLTDSHLRKVISELKKNGILIPKTTRSTYMVNPALIGKGTWYNTERLRQELINN